MFSMTTIASSTTSPVASTIANRVSVLIEKSKSFTNAKAPISDTGIVAAGMSVARQSSRKRNMTRMTRRIAPPRVNTTSRIDSPTTSVASHARLYFIPGGKRSARRSSSANAARPTSRALAVESWVTAMPTASWPLNCMMES